MNKVEKIKGEIERRKEIHFKDYHINKNGNSADYGACNALTQLLSFIDSLEEEPVSNDLEEAAWTYYDKNKPLMPHEWDLHKELISFFIAGAQWQKERDQSTIELAEDHAYLAGQEKAIAKACEWLENYFKGVSSGTVYLEDFKKAIKE